MNLEISDHLLEKYSKVIKRRMLSDDVSTFVETLIEVELKKFGEEGYTIDELTGCKNRFQLAHDFQKALWGKKRNDLSVFCNKYLCIDIDKFYEYVDIHGLRAGDDLLKKLANLLQEKYPGKNIYRYGGDEFVVEMQDSPLQLVQLIGVEIKYSVINVEINLKKQGRNNFERFFSMFIEMGILKSSLRGTTIKYKH